MLLFNLPLKTGFTIIQLKRYENCEGQLIGPSDKLPFICPSNLPSFVTRAFFCNIYSNSFPIKAVIILESPPSPCPARSGGMPSMVGEAVAPKVVTIKVKG
jgi:hypothetical protein